MVSNNAHVTSVGFSLFLCIGLVRNLRYNKLNVPRLPFIKTVRDVGYKSYPMNKTILTMIVVILAAAVSYKALETEPEIYLQMPTAVQKMASDTIKEQPKKIRLVRTVIRCKDGTIAQSKHRIGTCAAHGGVKNWAEPVYETTQ